MPQILAWRLRLFPSRLRRLPAPYRFSRVSRAATPNYRGKCRFPLAPRETRLVSHRKNLRSAIVAARGPGNLHVNPRAVDVEELELIVPRGGEQNRRSKRGLGKNGSARLFHHYQILGMRLIVLNFLQALQLRIDLLHTPFFRFPLHAQSRNFVSARNGDRRPGNRSASRRSHDTSRGAGRKIELRPGSLQSGTRNRNQGLSAELVAKPVKQIQFKPAIRWQDLVTRFGRIAISVPSRDFCSHTNSRCARRIRNKIDRKLVERSLITAKRLIFDSNKAIHDRQFLSRVRLHLL